MTEPLDDLAEGLWTRLRNVLIALDRVDRLEGAGNFAGWVEAFQCDQAQIQTTAQDWILRAVRTACDPINYQILVTVHAAGELSIAQLMQATRLTRVDLWERVKELAGAGLVVQSLESDAVQGTRAADGLLAWVEALGEQIAAHARAGLARDNPPPRFHRPTLSP